MVYIRSSFLSASRGRAVWTSASRRPEGSTLTRKLRPCGSRAANRHIQRTVGGATVSPWRQVTHDPGTSETSLLPFSTAPTLEPALSSSFFFSLRSTPFLPTRKKKRVKRGPRSSFFFFPSFSSSSLSPRTTNTGYVRIDVHKSRVVFPGPSKLSQVWNHHFDRGKIVRRRKGLSVSRGVSRGIVVVRLWRRRWNR